MRENNSFFRTLNRMAKMVLVSVLVSVTSGCDKDNPDNPENSVPDPQGTVTMRIRNDDKGATALDGIRIDDGNNFIGAFMASLGGMKGLGNVTKMPASGWSEKVAVKPGTGYVALKNNVFYRIYVTDYLYEAGSSGISGAEVKYQKPFTGWDGEGELTFLEETIQVGERGVQYLEVCSNNTAPVEVHSVKSSADWCLVTEKRYQLNNQKIEYAIYVTVSNTLINEDRTAEITFEYGSGKKTKKLLVKQTGISAAVTLYPASLNLSCTASENNFVRVDSNTVWAVQSAHPWCKVKKGTYNGQKGVYVEVENNVSGENRTASVSFKDSKSNVIKNMSVSQNTATISTNQREFVLESNHLSSQYLFSFYSELPLTIKSRADWCKVSGTTSVRIDPCENLSGQERQAYVVAELSPTLKDSVLVKQKAHVFEVKENDVGFDRTMNAKTIQVTTTASTVTFSCDKTWASGSWNANTKQVTVRVEANETRVDRTAELTLILNDGQRRVVTVQQNRYALKDKYDENGVKGVVFWVDGLRGKIVSEDKSSVLKWSVENILIGASDTKDGLKNMNVVKAINNWGTLYPAFKWCADKGAGWYLPAYEEIRLINQVTNLYAQSVLWSSTEYASDGMYGYRIQGTNASVIAKSSPYEVVAVYAFGPQ